MEKSDKDVRKPIIVTYDDDYYSKHIREFMGDFIEENREDADNGIIQSINGRSRGHRREAINIEEHTGFDISK